MAGLLGKEEDEDATAAADYVPLSAGTRTRKITAGGKKYVYGDTPALEQRLIFDQIAASLSMTPYALAKSITATGMDFEQRLATIRRYHEHRHSPTEVSTLLDAAMASHREEQRELRLRRLSYNQPQGVLLKRQARKRAASFLRSAGTSAKVRPSEQFNPVCNTPNPTKGGEDGEYIQSFLADDDTEFVTSLRQQPLDLPDPAAAIAAASAASTPRFEDEGKEEEGQPISWSLKTKPAPAGQTYRRAVQSSEEDIGGSSPSEPVARRLETISDIFEDGDSTDFSQVFADFSKRETRPELSTAKEYQSVQRSVSPVTTWRVDDGSDLMDQIFS